MCEEPKNKKRKISCLTDYSRGFNLCLDEKIEEIANLKYQLIKEKIAAKMANSEGEHVVRVQWLLEIFDGLSYDEFLRKYLDMDFSQDAVPRIIGKIKGKICEKIFIYELKCCKNMGDNSIIINIKETEDNGDLSVEKIFEKIKEIAEVKYKFIYDKAIELAVNKGENKMNISWFSDVFDSMPIKKFLAKFFDKNFSEDEIAEIIVCIKMEIKEKLLQEGFEIKESTDGLQYLKIKWSNPIF